MARQTVMLRQLLAIFLLGPAALLMQFGIAARSHAGPAEAVGTSATDKVAGRTLQEYADQLGADDRVVRLRAVKSLGVFGPAAGDELAKALDHDDAAVRYIAATELGRIAGEPLTAASDRLEKLATDKSSLAVQMAASFALCRAGRIDDHLPLLIERLQYPERGMACSAALLIGAIGPPAAAAIEPLNETYRKHRPGQSGGDYHLGGAAKNALRKLSPTTDR